MCRLRLLFFLVDTAERKAMEFVADLFELVVDLVIGCLLFYSLSLSLSLQVVKGQSGWQHNKATGLVGFECLLLGLLLIANGLLLGYIV